MNKWILIPILVILTMGTVANGALYAIERGERSELETQLEDLQFEFSSLHGDMAALEEDFFSLQGGFSGLEDDVSSLESLVAGFEGDISSLKDGVSALEGDVSSLDDNVSNLEGSVGELETGVSDLQGSLSSLEGIVDGLKGEIDAIEVLERSIMEAAAAIEPSVVRIDAIVQGSAIPNGTGVIVSDDGWVLTNAHVLEAADSFEIVLAGGETYGGSQQVFWHDTLDIALIKIDSNRDDFPVAELGSSSALSVGEQVVTAGFPFMPELSGRASFTAGIISATERKFGVEEITSEFGDVEWLQFDASINYGNSGGPLVNTDGEVVGINTLSFKYWDDLFWEGLHFAVPIDDVKPFIDEVIGG